MVCGELAIFLERQEAQYSISRVFSATVGSQALGRTVGEQEGDVCFSQ